jgi:hypothetical protein
MTKHIPLRIRVILLKGVMRRFWLNLFCKRYVRESIAKRQGECRRCGVCCHLIANKCGALKLGENGCSSCRIYRFYRLPNCCTFPIDARDIADRDLIADGEPCGYSFRDVG